MLQPLHFRPLAVGPWILWGGAALVLLLLPIAFSKGFALTMLSQMGIMVIFALSFNMLLGASGMLSFGHAVYSGLGAFGAIHALNAIAAGSLIFPVSLLPLIGGLVGAAFGVVLGYPTTRRAGTPFSMITLGIGELVFAACLMFPLLSGGEGGVTGNRTAGPPFLGIDGLSFGPQLQVYYLIAAWCLVCVAAMYAWTATPLGRIANAVRDNPERAEFIGYNTQRVRWMTLILSSFFAGVAGALGAINFEIVSAENVGALRSGAVLLAAYIGGIAVFFGPVLGAIVFTFFAVALSEYTKAWQLYLGVFFVLLVLFAPGGLASLILMNLRVLKSGRYARLADPLVGVVLTAGAMTIGLVMLVEFTYHLTLELGQGPEVRLFGLPFDTTGPAAWVWAGGTLIGGSLAFSYYRRRFSEVWDGIQREIQADAGERA